ncbi:MAG TPA: Mov34/MPN/PAD-1 family protein [Thermoplasmata archaeon]|nr:Mov34/MPN/PAD-1 family protein [Thermoplasmata archaeon]
MENVLIERGCFLGLATAAIEAYNRETDGFLVGNTRTRLVRSRAREVTVLRAAYPLQTADRKPNWVAHGNAKAFQRARRAMENLTLGYEVLGGFHSHTGSDGDAALSRTDLEYVADELRRRSRRPEAEATRWLEVVVALRKRAWATPHRVGWTTRPYHRKVGCTVALDAHTGYGLVLGGYWVTAEPDGAPGRVDVTADEAKLHLPWSA